MTYARVFIVVGLMSIYTITGDPLMAALYGTLAAHFFTRSLPWAISKFSSAARRAARERLKA
jgi:hypothetical protein